MLISPAFAQSGGFAEGGLGLMPIILVMVIFYFLLIRPPQKRAKQHKQMLSALKRGDKLRSDKDGVYPHMGQRGVATAGIDGDLEQALAGGDGPGRLI